MQAGGARPGMGMEMGMARDNKEMVHVLESALITWTKQIKNVLKQVGATVRTSS